MDLELGPDGVTNRELEQKPDNPFKLGITALGRPPTFTNGQDLLDAIVKYFDYVIKVEKVLTITGLCLYIGFESRQSFYDYEKKKPFAYVIKRARLVIENHYEQRSGYFY